MISTIWYPGKCKSVETVKWSEAAKDWGCGRTNRWNTGIFKAGKYSAWHHNDGHIIIHLSKPTESTIPIVNPMLIMDFGWIWCVGSSILTNLQ